MSSSGGQQRRVTIAGGGIATIEATLALRDLAADAAIEILAPQANVDYRPLAVLEPFALGEMPTFRISDFAAEQRASHMHDTLVAVDCEEHLIVTGRGARLPYDILVVATGAATLDAIPGAVTFRGHADQRRVGLLFEEYAEGGLRSLTIAVPAGEAWTLPAYELALMARTSLAQRKVSGVEIQVVTPEERPVAVFGEQASRAVNVLLSDAGVEVKTGAVAERFADGELHLADGGSIRTHGVVALPRLAGPGFPGLPSDKRGFLPTDDYGLVVGTDDVYAAGDVTTSSVKQGSLAAQQADTVAEAIAARLGAAVEPQPFRPVLSGLLLTGLTAHVLEADGARRAPWTPLSKISGRYLPSYLDGKRSAVRARAAV